MTEYTETAGGIVLNINGDVLVVNQHGRAWSLPKGHIEADEDKLEAAKREIHEESGISELQFIRRLGSYQRYKISGSGKDDTSEMKTITMFLFTTEQMELNPIDADNPEAKWVKREDVANLLTHKKDKEFFYRKKHHLDDTSKVNIIGYPPIIFACTLFGSIIVHLIHPLEFMPDNWFLRLGFGAVFFFYGGMIGLSAKNVMKRAGTPVKHKEETTAIATDGPYRYSRNPLYLAIFLIHLSFAVMLNSLWTLLSTVILILIIHYGVVLGEEKYLERKFEYRYLAYKQTARRWF